MKGALSVTGVPPQELVMVSVPVAGALLNVTLPDTSYKLVVVLHAVGTVVIAEMLQTVAQEGGAVNGVVSVQLGSAENTAVTVQPAPLAVRPASE